MKKFKCHPVKRENICYLDMIFAYRVPHEHSVEGGDLVDPHSGHADDLGYVVHGRDGQPASILSLGEVKEGNNLNKIR